MKRRGGIIAAAVLLCALLAAGAANTPERITMRCFRNHRAALEEDVQRSARGLASSTLDLIFNYWDGEHPILEYIAAVRGSVPASRYYGFFYSFDGVPVSFQNAGETLTAVSDQEWTWQGEGDNHGLVRRLEGCWFYFEAAL